MATFKETFARLVDLAAPPVPNINGLPAFRKKVNEILAPVLLNQWLPPLPKAVAKSPITQALSPPEPSKGPPFPSGLDISWPRFMSRGIQRLTTEGISAPYKTIKEKGLLEEIKREIQLVTGVHPGKKE